MEALNILKFWRTTSAGDELRNAAFLTDNEETDGEDSFFDLVFKSPNRGEEAAAAAAKKDYSQFIESPRDVFLSKSDFSNSKPQSPVATILRSAPKFRILLLAFRKSSRGDAEKTDQSDVKSSPSNQLSKSSSSSQSNRFSLKCRVAEVPVFARDNSLRSKMLKERSDNWDAFSDVVVSSEKPVPRYMKLIKPFYVKSRSTDFVTPSSSPVTAPLNLKVSEGSRMGGFKTASRNLGKSRSASAAVGVAPRRRDDSLLEHNDGIQGAILHCKKSYSSCEEQKRCSI